MRLIITSLLTLFSLAPSAGATAEFCHSTYCDPNEWVWYPRTPPRAPYGSDVKLSARGEWIDRNGHRVWANEGTQRSTVISMNNSDQHNGELAYQTAYDSYVFGKNNGLNKVQHVKNGGRWTQKITTGDGIEIYKDQAGNAAVQTPDGRWHVTDARGEYASSGVDLDRDSPSKAMIADKGAKKPATEGRQLASVKESPVKAPEAPAAKAAAPDAADMAQASDADTAAPAAASAEAAPAAPVVAAAAPVAAPAAEAMVPAAQVPLTPISLAPVAAVAPAALAAGVAPPPAAAPATAAPAVAASAAPAAASPVAAAAVTPVAAPAVAPVEAPVTTAAAKPAAAK